MAIHFAHVGCAALLATGKGSDQDSFDLDGDTPDKPTPKVLARVKEKVDELQEQLGAEKHDSVNWEGNFLRTERLSS